MACDPNQLLADAKCFQCMSHQQLQMVIASLLCQISTGGVTASNLFSGHGSPVGVVFPTSNVAIYIDEDNGDQWSWYSGAWH